VLANTGHSLLVWQGGEHTTDIDLRALDNEGVDDAQEWNR
jgi:hypothetical protein